MMANYKRSTRMCTFDDLQLSMQHAMRDFFVQHEIPGLEAQIVQCCETVSERIKVSTLAKWFGEDRDEVYSLAVFYTPEWLVWARCGDHSTTTVVAARLQDIRVNPVNALTMNDRGIDIDGFVDGSFTKVHGYIALGPEPEAETFRDALEKAVNTANPPRRLMDLFGKVPR